MELPQETEFSKQILEEVSGNQCEFPNHWYYWLSREELCKCSWGFVFLSFLWAFIRPGGPLYLPFTFFPVLSLCLCLPHRSFFFFLNQKYDNIYGNVCIAKWSYAKRIKLYWQLSDLSEAFRVCRVKMSHKDFAKSLLISESCWIWKVTVICE